MKYSKMLFGLAIVAMLALGACAGQVVRIPVTMPNGQGAVLEAVSALRAAVRRLAVLVRPTEGIACIHPLRHCVGGLDAGFKQDVDDDVRLECGVAAEPWRVDIDNPIAFTVEPPRPAPARPFGR